MLLHATTMEKIGDGLESTSGALRAYGFMAVGALIAIELTWLVIALLLTA